MSSAIWVGRDCKFVWRNASNTGSSEFGSEPFGASSGAPDPAIDYLVRIERSDGTILRQEYVKENYYTYSYEKNFEDTAGVPVRSFTFKVWARNMFAISPLPAQLAVTNPAPGVPLAIAATPGAGSITVSCAFPPDTDVAGILIWRSTSSGFTPGAGNLVYQGPNSSIVFDGLAPGNTYYFRVAAFDTFGTDVLNTSSEFSAQPVAQLSAISQDLGDITAGSIRGVNVNASSHTTKGSYLTSALSGGETTVNVRNTADFASSGSGWIIDTTNDRDAISWAGKTAGTLTGCSGVLAHNNGATIIPQVKCAVLDGPTNEIRFFGDRGDGTIVELASIGLSNGSDLVIGSFGSMASGYSRGGIIAASNSLEGVVGGSSSAAGVKGVSVDLQGVRGSSTNGEGGWFGGNATSANLLLPNCNGSTFPTGKISGQLATVGGRLYWTDGTNWLPLTHPYFESSEQTLTNSTDTAAAHGLGRIPKLAQVIIRCKTAEFGYAVGDEVLLTQNGDVAGGGRNPTLYVNSTNIGFVYAAGGVGIARRDAGNVGLTGVITNGNWKAVLRAW